MERTGIARSNGESVMVLQIFNVFLKEIEKDAILINIQLICLLN